MNEEQKELVREFSRGDYAKIALVMLDLQLKPFQDKLSTHSLTKESEQEFLAMKYELEGAKKLVSHFKTQLSRLRALDLDAKK